MISKAIYISIKNTLLRKLWLHLREYEWDDDWCLISNDVPIILYLIFRSINPDNIIGVSNLNDETKKETIATFGKRCKIYS